MVTIELTNGLWIEVDPMCYTLKRKRFVKKKNSEERKEVITTHGYFSNLNGAVKKFLTLRNIDEHDKAFLSMTDYVRAVEKSNEEAVNVILDEWNRRKGEQYAEY